MAVDQSSDPFDEKNSDAEREFFEGESRSEEESDGERLIEPRRFKKSALILLSMTAMIVVAMLWVRSDFSYALKIFSRPIALGEAEQIDTQSLEDNSYVSMEGVPRFLKSIAFSSGFQALISDEQDKKLFPLVGQPRIFVQWKERGAESSYGKTAVLPGKFEGRLLRRESLERGYEKLWRFLEKRMMVSAPLDSVVVVDGDAPGNYWWVLALYGVLMALAAVNLFKLRALWRARRALGTRNR